MEWIKFVILWSCLVGIHLAEYHKTIFKTPKDIVNSPLWNCPSKELTTVDIIKSYHYPIENHTVRTKDGYMLEVFRIPDSHECHERKAKKVVFLMHGMYSSSDAFLLSAKNIGLPYMLADKCYDVWMGNARGNRYSQRHPHLGINDTEYWHFSWPEIGLEDLAASFEYITFLTKQNDLNCVCHGQGCAALMVLLSLRKEYNFIVHNAVFLAPMVYMTHFKASVPWRDFFKLLEHSMDGEARPSLLPDHTVLKDVAKRMCPKMTCECNYNLIYGNANHQRDPLVITRFLATHPSSISVRQLRHLFQVKSSGKFQQYDYGVEKNIIMYNQSTPPEYNLEKVRPHGSLHIFYSDGDWWVSKKDIAILKGKLSKAMFHHIEDSKFGHGDFLHGHNDRTLINIPILEIFRRNSKDKSDKHVKHFKHH
ncbi:lipase 3-like [Drosophila bipectinata]|uniref:lipase 3-like n=1 Tax=Drosophila bipectinata TaxID=42026 RepID=UPI001C8B04DC|nr:lipase 3-like [Drosophila bipectinata]